MNGTNLVVLSGSIGKDPETKLAGEKNLMEFSIAVNETFTKKDGEKVDKTTWFEIKAWGDLAKNLIFLRKGAYVIITGKLVMEEWTDTATSAKRKKMKIEAKTITSVTNPNGPQKNGEKTEAAQQAEEYTKAENASVTSEAFVTSSVDDDLPF